MRVRHTARRDRGSTPDVHLNNLHEASPHQTDIQALTSSMSKTWSVTRQPKSPTNKKTRTNARFEPPTSPIASCSFLFCPPLSVSALCVSLFPKSQSINSCLRSSTGESSARFTALHTRRVCRQLSCGKRTFFCGTMPSVPCGGRASPPANVTDPLVCPTRPPRTESVVDLPALHIQMVSNDTAHTTQRRKDERERTGPHPFDPSSTNIPDLGISRVRSATAVTSSFLEWKTFDVENFFSRFLIEIAASGAMGCASSTSFRLRQGSHDRSVGYRASYSLRSSKMARYGHKTMPICSGGQ
jgi:hypothetical protein